MGEDMVFSKNQAVLQRQNYLFPLRLRFLNVSPLEMELAFDFSFVG
jgi:hypothetical protein